MGDEVIRIGGQGSKKTEKGSQTGHEGKLVVAQQGAVGQIINSHIEKY